MFCIWWSREGAIVQIFVAVVTPGVPRGGLTDATVDAEEHLNALVVGKRARTGGSEDEKVVETRVEGRNVEFVVGRFEGNMPVNYKLNSQ